MKAAGDSNICNSAEVTELVDECAAKEANLINKCFLKSDFQNLDTIMICNENIARNRYFLNENLMDFSQNLSNSMKYDGIPLKF